MTGCLLLGTCTQSQICDLTKSNPKLSHLVELPSKDLDVGDGVLDLAKGRINAKVGAVHFPFQPVGRGFVGEKRNGDLGNVCLLCKAEITEEIIIG